MALWKPLTLNRDINVKMLMVSLMSVKNQMKSLFYSL